MSSKRKKNDNSDEESDRIDWQKEYLKMKEEKDEKLKDAKEKLETKYEELRKMVAKNRKLEIQLKHVNETLLRSKSMLSARGVIEWLEGDKLWAMPGSVRRGVRHDRWEWIFNNDATFRNQVRSYFPRSTAQRVAKIVDKILSNASADAQSSVSSNGLEISDEGDTTDQKDVLKAICATIPCNLSIE